MPKFSVFLYMPKFHRPPSLREESLVAASPCTSHHTYLASRRWVIIGHIYDIDRCQRHSCSTFVGAACTPAGGLANAAVHSAAAVAPAAVLNSPRQGSSSSLLQTAVGLHCLLHA